VAKFFVKPSQRRPAPEPLKLNARKVLSLGIAIWVLALIATLAFYQSLSDAGLGWWLHTTVVGVGLCIFCLMSVRRTD
jgi:fatty acid desaturase